MSDIYGADQATWQRVERGVKLAESMGGQGQAPRRGPRDEGGGSASQVYPMAATLDSSSNGLYMATVYPGGLDVTSTAYSVRLQVLAVAYGETVPTQTQCLACPSAVLAYGSGEGS